MSAKPKPSETVLRELLASVPPPRAPRRARSRKAAPRTDARRRCSYTLPEGLVVAFRTLCAEQDRPPRDVVEELLRSYVARHEVVSPKKRRRRTA